MIRPELIQAAQRWRELLVGMALAALGLWAAFGSGGILALLGYGMAALGAGLALAGVQRGRFRQGTGEGPGIVRVTEGQISYMGPLNGGAVARDLITALHFDPRSYPPVWIFFHNDGAPLHIPVTAQGADQLFDLFEQLPGLDMQRVLALRADPGKASVRLWAQNSVPRLG